MWEYSHPVRDAPRNLRRNHRLHLREVSRALDPIAHAIAGGGGLIFSLTFAPELPAITYGLRVLGPASRIRFGAISVETGKQFSTEAVDDSGCLETFG